MSQTAFFLWNLKTQAEDEVAANAIRACARHLQTLKMLAKRRQAEYEADVAKGEDSPWEGDETMAQRIDNLIEDVYEIGEDYGRSFGADMPEHEIDVEDGIIKPEAKKGNG